MNFKIIPSSLSYYCSSSKTIGLSFWGKEPFTWLINEIDHECFHQILHEFISREASNSLDYIKISGFSFQSFIHVAFKGRREYLRKLKEDIKTNKFRVMKNGICIF